MQFAHPTLFVLLWLLPAVVLFLAWSARSKRRALESFARAEQLRALIPEPGRGRAALRGGLVVAACTLLVLAATGPRWGFQWEEIHRRGIDLVVALDLSRSMRAEDVSPSRLERAKREILDLVDLMEGDRAGLVAFAGVAYVQIPLTLDYGVFHVFMDALDTDLVPVQGTDLGAALDAAVKAFDPKASTGKAVLLITDGEDNEGKGLEAAKRAKEAGVRVFTIGVGAGDGAPIPERDGAGGFHKDRGGAMVLSRLDESGLQKIALETGGAYVRSVSGDMDLQEIYQQDIRRRMESRELSSTRQKRWEERFQWPLGVAIGLLFAERWMSDRRRRAGGSAPRGWPRLRWPRLGRARGRKGAEAAVFALAVSLASAPARAADAPFTGKALRDAWRAWLTGESAREKGEGDAASVAYGQAVEGFLGAQVERPDEPRLDYDLGAARYRAGHYPEAELAYDRASREPRLRPDALYNRGNAEFQQGKLEEAIATYEEALALRPEHADTKHNLEYARRELRRRLEEARKTAQQQPRSSKDDRKQPEREGEQPPPQQGEQDEERQGRQGQQEKQERGDDRPGQDREGEGERPSRPEADPDGGSVAHGEEGDERDEESRPGQEVQPGDLNPDEAERLLQSLREDRRKHQAPPRGGKTRAKDW